MAVDYGTIIDGASRSDNINADGLPVDMEPMTALLDPNSYVFEALTRTFGAQIACDQMKREFRERRLIPNYTTIATADAAGQSHIEVVDHSRIKNDMLLYIPRTGDLLLVQDTSIDATVDIVDATDGTGTLPSATQVDDKVVILGDAHAEGEDVPAAYSVESVSAYDYIMQKDRRVQATDIEEAIAHYDKRERRALDRKIAWIEFKRDVNALFYVGKRTRETSSASGPRRHVCGGLFEKLTENNHDFSQGGQSFTLEALGNVMADTKYHGESSDSKVGLFGTNAWKEISAWPRDALRVSVFSKKWGIRINQLITGFGDIDVAYDPVLSADKGLEDRGVIVDPRHIRKLYLRGLRTKMYLKIPNLSTLHQVVDAVSGTFGLQVKFEELHAQMSGIGQA